MKFKLAAVVAALMIGQSAMAQGMPQVCPEVAKLQAVGVSIPVQNPQAQGEWWGVTLNDTFGTNDSWTFVAGPVSAQNQQSVTESVNAKLITLSEGVGPFTVDDQDLYGCYYTSQTSDFVAFTMTPAVALDSVMKFAKQARIK